MLGANAGSAGLEGLLVVALLVALVLVTAWRRVGRRNR
jgi:hypothetical protein